MKRSFVNALGGLVATSAIAFGSIGVAQADLATGPITVSVWTGPTLFTNTTTNTTTGYVTRYAALPPPGTPNSYCTSSTPCYTATFTYTGPIDFSCAGTTCPYNSFGEFGFSSSNISAFSGKTYSSGPTNPSSLSLNSFLSTVMSTGSYGITSYMEFMGSYSLAAGDTVSITHDDGASLYLCNASSWSNCSSNSAYTTYVSSPGPTQTKTSTGLPLTNSNSSGSFDLVYVEANGAPSVLQVTATPEFHWDSAAAALSLLFGGLVVVRGRRGTFG